MGIDMESHINELLTNGAMVGLFLAIVSSGITLWLGFMIQAWIKNRIAKNRIQDSEVLAIGTILREKTAVGTRDGVLVDFGNTHTRIDFDESSTFVPNDEFSNSRFEIVKPGYSTMRTVPDCGGQK
jgi:ribosomal protein L14